ncbi:MAG: UDP-N-acetylmuramate dehydrogenase [Candidatus Komeilibacteria bacterium]
MTDILNKLKELAVVQENYPLSKLTTFKIGGPAKYFIEVENIDNLSDIFTTLKDNNIQYFILGGGANILASDDGFDGAVIKLKNTQYTVISEDNDEIIVKVDAGLVWDDFVAITVDNNWWGVENMSYIPGSFGGLVTVSAGAYGQQVSDFVVKVNVFNIEDNKFEELSNKECEFKYRSSLFTSKGENKYIVLSAEIKLKKNGQPSVNYPDVIKYFADKKIDKPSIKEVREALHFIRFNKLPDWEKTGTAGSYFKNIYLQPEDMKSFMEKVDKNFGKEYKDEAENMCKKFADQYGCKIPTGFVLDKLLNLKGKTMGGAKVYDKQALVIINDNNATAKDVLMLVSYIKQQVRDKTGVQLQEEVRYLGF